MMTRMKSVTLHLVVMMMTACVSAGPLPPSSRTNDSKSVNLQQQKNENLTRTDDSKSVNLQQQKNENLTRLNDPVNLQHQVNDTISDGLQGARLFNAYNLPQDMNLSYDIRPAAAPPRHCYLATCAVVNLGSSLQTGDEVAGAATTDSLGYGKK